MKMKSTPGYLARKIAAGDCRAHSITQYNMGMKALSRLLLVTAVAEGALVRQPLHTLSKPSTGIKRVSSVIRCAEEPPPEPPAPSPARKLTPQEAIAAAEEKLANAPSTFNNWTESEQPPPVSGPLSADQLDLINKAPLVLGGLSLALFVFNTIGLFGEGPDLDQLADDLVAWSYAQQ